MSLKDRGDFKPGSARDFYDKKYEKAIESISEQVRIEIERVARKITVQSLDMLKAGEDIFMLPTPSGNSKQLVQDICDGKTFGAVIPEIGVTVILGEAYLRHYREHHRLNDLQRKYLRERSFWRSIVDFFRGKSFPSVPSPPPTLGSEKQDAEALEAATRVLRSKAIRKRLCAALRSVSGDLKDIYKPLVKILIPFGTLSGVTAAFGTLHFQINGVAMNLVAIAVLAVIVARAGVESLCSEHSGTIKE